MWMSAQRASALAAMVLLGVLAVSVSGSVRSGARPSETLDADLEEFSLLAPIDAHIHLFHDDARFGALMQRLNLRGLNICVVDDRDPFYRDLNRQRTLALKVRRVTGGRAVICTTFSPYDFEKPDFARRAIRQLDADFAAGAIAVKIYKVMGMEMKSQSGKYVMPDDPAFEPIYQDIAAHNRTVVAHIAEPDSCWQAPDRSSPDYEYYKKHPEEYAYLHPEWPSKASILAARDHFVEENPKLRVVGAHLGSMEVDVDQIAQRFDRYPNFAVDTAARVPYLMMQPHDKVRAFLIKYQDRVLYGTDLEGPPDGNVPSELQNWNDTYRRDWVFFSSDRSVEYLGHTYRGLMLPEPVLRKIFHDNAVHWLPGILEGK
jgi:predicted TIM-barrel fold metal-dependent hydrolase